MPISSRPLNSWDIIKIIALLLMFCDHAGSVVFTSDEQRYWLRAIGRGAMPPFLFLAGFASSYRFKWDIFLLGLLLSMFDLALFRELHTQNILFTILACRIIFNWFEKRGHIIQKPYEWYVGSVALFLTMAIIEYGSIGFLFALWGYMQRHSQHYPKKLQQHFSLLIFVTYGAFSAYFSIPPISTALMAVILYCNYLMLSRLAIQDIHANWCPAWVKKTAKCCSYYSVYIYVFHIMALEWATKIPV